MNEVKIACYGMSGHQILGKMPELERARLVAISGVDEERYNSLKEQFPERVGDAAYYPALEDLLEQSDCDLISLCSDYRAHQADHAIQSLKAGRHVLAEKPMACSFEKLAELREAAEASGKEVRTMNPMVYDPRIWGVKEIVDSGEIGEVVHIYGLKSYPYRDTRPQDTGKDGGLTMQAGIHAVSFVRFTTGLEFAEIHCQDTKHGNPKPGDLRIASNVACRMDSGALCSILVNYCNPHAIGFHGNDQLRVFGTKGMVELADGFSRRMVATHETGPREYPLGTPSHKYPQDLIDCILDGTPTLLTQADSFRNTEVVLAAQKSADTGETVRV